MKKYFLSLIMIALLNTHEVFAVDRLGVEMTSTAIAMKLENAKDIPKESILKLFHLLSPLDKEGNNSKGSDLKEREKIIQDWKLYTVSITEEENQQVIENFALQVLALTKQENISNLVLDTTLNLIVQEYYKSF